jgi:hypothetical protein
MPRRKQSDPEPHLADAPSPKTRTAAPEISFIEPPATDEAQIPEQRQHFPDDQGGERTVVQTIQVE